MITVNAEEIAIIQKASNRKLAIEELVDKALEKQRTIKNKELLCAILDEYVKMNRIIEAWWEKMGEKYNFDHTMPHNVNYKTRIVTPVG